MLAPGEACPDRAPQILLGGRLESEIEGSSRALGTGGLQGSHSCGRWTRGGFSDFYLRRVCKIGAHKAGAHEGPACCPPRRAAGQPLAWLKAGSGRPPGSC